MEGGDMATDIRGPVRNGLFGLVLLLVPTAGLAQDAPALQPVGSVEALQEIIEADSGPDCELYPQLCPPPGQTPGQDQGGIQEVLVTASRRPAPSITNNQEAGVDEGDVVKARGDTLVILRRGRLFTVSTAGGRLRAVDSIEAYPPGVDAQHDWYDEMLVSGDRVIVIGYSYGRGGTEINRFRMDAVGRLTFEDSHHLSSDDYYSSRNYASRLVGDELVVYTPVGVGPADDPLAGAPALSRWRPGDEEAADEARRRPLIRPEDLYRAPGLGETPGMRAQAIHTVIRCDLSAAELSCGATGILGPWSRSFYVTPSAVYVWMAASVWDLPKGEEPDAWLYRIPLEGGPPQAAAARGVPIDQFSFLEDRDQSLINVMVVSEGEGDGMWGAEGARGRAALLRLPFERFGDGEDLPEDDDYRVLPAIDGGWGARNRYVGDHLLYSAVVQNDRSRDDRVTPGEEGRITVVPLNGDPLIRFTLPGEIGRIEAMGPAALVVSGGDDVLFTTIDLQTPRPTISDQYVMVGSEQSESRSHAFYYQPDLASPDGSRGVLGLPVTRYLPNDGPGAAHTERTLETIAFLRRDGAGRLRDIGSLDAEARGGRVDDGCVASCIDWYGDARPIFLAGRVFALLGYELVEGRERGGRIHEVRRIDFVPEPPRGPRPYDPD
jgi:hypothetical protein